MKHTQALLDVMAQLRNPDGGCPWDIEQNFKSIVQHTIEEAYEVADAIERNDMASLKEELGDLLLQVVFYAQMAKEEGLFNFEEVAEAIHSKLIRRHPHVFGNAEVNTAEEQTILWEALKSEEREKKSHTSALDDIPRSFPALLRASKLQKRASKSGFDWEHTEQVFDKIQEELGELKTALADGLPHENVKDELGDVLFAVTNLANHLKVNAEEALHGTNAKFERRFRHVETRLAEQGKTPAESTLEEMDRFWDEAKKHEK